jgi:hypothetical protein
MKQQVNESWKKFTEWFLTGETQHIALSDQEKEVQDFRRQMKEELLQLQSRGLPIRIVTL